MAKGLRGLKGRAVKILIRIVVGLAVVACAGWFGYRAYLNRDGLPDFPMQDVGENQYAGKIERQTGATFMRPMLKSDVDTNLLSGGPEAAKEGWAPLKAESIFTLATLFHLKGGGNLQILTQGNWIIALDGEGEFILEDARRDQAGQNHTASWFMKKGTFRAKPHDYDPTQHWLKIRTAVATVYVQNGEMGIRLAHENGGGQIWLITGKAIIVWNDGRRKVLTEKGMDYI